MGSPGIKQGRVRGPNCLTMCSVIFHRLRTIPSKMPDMCLWRKKNFYCVFIDWLIQQMFTEHRLGAGHCSQQWGCSEQTDRHLCPCKVEYSSAVMHRWVFWFWGLFRCALLCLRIELENNCTRGLCIEELSGCLSVWTCLINSVSGVTLND